MANLETLELTINGSAEQAKTGIDGLISRLSALSNAITKPYSDLRDFNAALKETTSLTKRINITNIGKRMGASAAKAAGDGRIPAGKPPTAKEIADSNARMEELRKAAALPAEALAAQQAVSKRLIDERMAATAAKRAAFEARQRATAEAKVAEEVQKTTEATKEQGSGLAKVKEGFKSMTSGVVGFFSKVKRIATTMLIRSAIRGLIKDVKEGVNNFYEWSKLNNGEFAKSFDTIKAKGQELKNSIGAAIAPVIAAAIPVVQALANAAINAFNWVNQLIALLSGKNYWTKATDNVDAYTDSVNKAGGAAKEWLASFDELNVMTSGGGGGGGGASGITSDMFENTTQFNTALKEIVGFIKDNFEDIKLIAGEIGVAILAWKLSQAFAETLPALSQLAGLIGVGAVIAIQLQASYLLTDKYLKTGQEGWLIASALTTAIGAAAAGTIAKKIFGGKIAMATIGFALVANAITDIVANVQNTDVKALSKEGILTSISAALKAGAGAGVLLSAFTSLTGMPLLAAAGGAAIFTFLVSTGLKLFTQKDDIRWGNIKLTETEVQAFVAQRMFETDPNIIMNIIADNVKAGKVEREKIEKDLMDIMGTYQSVRLGINMSESLALLRDQLNQLINDVHDYTLNAKETGRLTLQFTPTLGGSTAEEQAEWFKGYSAGWDIVDKFYADKGKEIASLFVENEKGEIKLKSPELLQEIMSSMNEITSTITESNIVSSALSNMSIGLGDLTQATGDNVIKYFNQYKADLTASYEDLVKEQYIKQGELVAALSKIDPNSQEYKDAVREYERMGKNLAQAVQDGVESKIQPGKDMVMEWLLGQHGKGSVNVTWTTEYLSDIINVDGLQDALKAVLTDAGFDKYEFEAMNLVGVTGWDFLHKDLKKRFLNSVYIDESTIKELKAMEVSADDLVNLVNWDAVTYMAQNDFVKSMTSAYGSEGIKIIKKKFPDIKVTDIVKFSAWDDFVGVEKLNFIDAIGKAFGAGEAANAAKQAGIDLEAAIREGMNSQNEDIKKTAKKWAELMGIEIRGGDYKVKPTVDDDSKPKIQGKIATFISGTNGKVTKIDAEVPESAKTAVKNTIAGISAVVNPKANVTQTVKDGVKSEFETIKPTVSVTANANVKFNDIKGAFVKALGNVQSYLGNILMGKITFKSGGGLVDSGDMFVANENGIPEMIGRFGNQTGVANTEQIVAGISRGVSEANDEQNYLLREQNALLRAILEKEGSSGIPGASAAFGRTVARSLDMYNGLVGGR